MEKHKSAERALEKETAAFRKVDNDAQALKRALAGVEVANRKEAAPVADLYTQLGYDIRSVPGQYGVNVRTFRMNTQVQSDTDLGNLGQPFAKAKQLKVVSVLIEGNFAQYEQFKQFMHWFDQYTMSISSLTVKRNNFTMVVDIYGI